MSRTIRNKGRYLLEIEQLNNPFRYIKLSWYKPYYAKAEVEKIITREIERNIEVNEEIEQLKKERHRDGFPVTCRWKRYIEKTPRVYYKMAIARSMKMDLDYICDERGNRKVRRAMASNWD